MGVAREEIVMAGSESRRRFPEHMTGSAQPAGLGAPPALTPTDSREGAAWRGAAQAAAPAAEAARALPRVTC